MREAAQFRGVWALTAVFAVGCTALVNPDPNRLNGGGRADAGLDDPDGHVLGEDGGLVSADSGPAPGEDAGSRDAGAGDDGGAVCLTAELCNGVDDDCNGAEDDNLDPPACPLMLGVCAGSFARCGGADGWLECGVDSYPERYEVEETSCDGFDNDCDGTEDEGCDCSPGDERDCGSDIGECSLGTQYCVDGTYGDCIGGAGPTDEVCDGLDNNCSGGEDEGLTRPACELTRGVCAGSRAVCGGESGWSECGPGRYGALYQYTETLCDGHDNDCDGMTDEGCAVSCGFPGSACGSDQVCACPALAASCASGGTCVDLFGSYVIHVTSATFPALNGMGEAWDADLSAPDPFVEVEVRGTLLGQTTTRDNTRFATWSDEYFSATLNDGDLVRFRVWDEDLFIHDSGLNCTVYADSFSLSNRAFSCSSALGVNVTAEFIPSR